MSIKLRLQTFLNNHHGASSLTGVAPHDLVNFGICKMSHCIVGMLAEGALFLFHRGNEVYSEFRHSNKMADSKYSTQPKETSNYNCDASQINASKSLIKEV